MDIYARSTNGVDAVESLDADLATEAYNFERFETKHVVGDASRTFRGHGLRPGSKTPDFELPRVGGGSQRLSFLYGKPIVLRFGSFT